MTLSTRLISLMVNRSVRSIAKDVNSGFSVLPGSLAMRYARQLRLAYFTASITWQRAYFVDSFCGAAASGVSVILRYPVAGSQITLSIARKTPAHKRESRDQKKIVEKEEERFTVAVRHPLQRQPWHPNGLRGLSSESDGRGCVGKENMRGWRRWHSVFPAQRSGERRR